MSITLSASDINAATAVAAAAVADSSASTGHSSFFVARGILTREEEDEVKHSNTFH